MRALQLKIWPTLLAFVAACCAPAHAGEVITVGGVQYETVEQFKVGAGELVLHLKPKAQGGSSKTTTTGATTTASAEAADTGDKKQGESDQSTKEKTLDAVKAKAESKIATVKSDFAKEISDAALSTESTALTAIGVTPGDFNTPATPKDFGAAIAKGFDGSGKLKDGVAIQFAPASLFFRSTLQGGDRFEKSNWMQAWARTSVEIASSRSDDTRIGQQGALALSVGLIDGTDPRLLWKQLSECAETARDEAYARAGIQRVTPRGQPAPTLAITQVEDEVNKQTKDCFDTQKKRLGDLSLQPKLYVGYDHSWYTGDSQLAKDGTKGPRMLWASYSRGLSGMNDPDAVLKTLFQASVTRKLNLQVKDPGDDTKLVNQDRTDAMVRIRATRDRWNAFVDAGLSRVHTGPTFSDKVRRYGFGAEYKVSDNLWLVLGSITEHGYVNGGKTTLLNTGLRFGQSDVSLLAPSAAAANK